MYTNPAETLVLLIAALVVLLVTVFAALRLRKEQRAAPLKRRKTWQPRD